MATGKWMPRKALRPFPAELPPHIIERDALALNAGLTIERAWGGYRLAGLLSVYRGSRAALVASPFVEDKANLRIPASVRHCVKAGLVQMYAPGSSYVIGAFRSPDGTCYVKFMDEMPAKMGKLENGTEFYLYDDRAVYVGGRDALLADAIATEDDLPDSGDFENPSRTCSGRRLRYDQSTSHVERANGFAFEVFQCARIGRDCYEVVMDFGAEQRLREARGEEATRAAPYAYKSADEFRDTSTTLLGAFAGVLVGSFKAPGVGGVEYAFDPKSRERAARLLSEIAELLQVAAVREVQQKPAAAQGARQSLPAVPDASFNRFLGRLLPD